MLKSTQGSVFFGHGTKYNINSTKATPLLNQQKWPDKQRKISQVLSKNSFWDLQKQTKKYFQICPDKKK